MSLKQLSLNGLLWDFSGKIGLQGVGLVVSIILARILSPEDFGILAIIFVLINLASVFMDLGFSTALVQRAEINESHYTSVFYLNVGMGFLLSLMVFMAAPLFASLFEHPQLTNLTRAMSIIFIVNAFGNVTRAHLRREMNFKAISVANIIGAGISGVMAIYMAVTGYGIWSLVVQCIANQLLANLVLYFYYPFHYTLKFRFQALKELRDFSLKIFFSGFLDAIFINLDSLLIGKILTPTILGYYYRAKSLENFSIRYISSSISSVLLPGLSSIQNEPEKFKLIIIKIFHLLSFISFLGSGLLFVGSHEIIILLFSQKWEPSILMFQILISGGFASQIFILFYNTFLSTGNARKYLIINITNKVLLLFGFIALFVWGITMYLMIYTLIQILVFFLSMNFISKILEINNLFFLITIKYLLLSILIISIQVLIKQSLGSADLVFNLIFSLLFYFVMFVSLTRLFRFQGVYILYKESRDLISNFKY